MFERASSNNNSNGNNHQLKKVFIYYEQNINVLCFWKCDKIKIKVQIRFLTDKEQFILCFCRPKLVVGFIQIQYFNDLFLAILSSLQREMHAFVFRQTYLIHLFIIISIGHWCYYTCSLQYNNKRTTTIIIHVLIFE